MGYMSLVGKKVKSNKAKCLKCGKSARLSIFGLCSKCQAMD